MNINSKQHVLIITLVLKNSRIMCYIYKKHDFFMKIMIAKPVVLRQWIFLFSPGHYSFPWLRLEEIILLGYCYQFTPS